MKYCNLSILLLLTNISIFAQTTAQSGDTLAKASQKSVLSFPFITRSLETSFGFGGVMAVFFKPMRDAKLRTSDADILALYTLRNQKILVGNSTLYFPHENKIVRFQTSYSYFPDNFWGLGNYTVQSQKEGYSQSQFVINPQYLQRLWRKLYVGVTYLYQNTGDISYKPNGDFEKYNVVGKDGGNVSGIGPMLSWDSRNSSYSPSAGFFAEVRYMVFDQRLGSTFNFNMLDADIRKYFALTGTTVLALQGIAGIHSGDVPFRQLEKLGGTDMMRGYYAGRYTDKCLLASQFEVRQHLIGRFGVVGFGAMGEVAPNLKGFYLPYMHYTYGGGVRIALIEAEKLNLRVDYGRALHNNAVVLQIREAF